MTLDVDRLRDELLDYFGTAVASGLTAAAADLFEVQDADPETLIGIAEDLDWDLYKYEAVSGYEYENDTE